MKLALFAVLAVLLVCPSYIQGESEDDSALERRYAAFLKALAEKPFRKGHIWRWEGLQHRLLHARIWTAIRKSLREALVEAEKNTYPGSNHNTSVEVHTVNGTKTLMNTTVEKSDDGISQTKIIKTFKVGDKVQKVIEVVEMVGLAKSSEEEFDGSGQVEEEWENSIERELEKAVSKRNGDV